MSDLDDVLENLDNKEKLSAELRDILEEVKRSEDAVKELEYDFNMVSVSFKMFGYLSVSSLEKMIPTLREFMGAVDKNDRDNMRLKAKEVAQILRNDTV